MVCDRGEVDRIKRLLVFILFAFSPQMLNLTNTILFDKIHKTKIIKLQGLPFVLCISYIGHRIVNIYHHLFAHIFLIILCVLLEMGQWQIFVDLVNLIFLFFGVYLYH